MISSSNLTQFGISKFDMTELLNKLFKETQRGRVACQIAAATKQALQGSILRKHS
jgi:hypothetical protein